MKPSELKKDAQACVRINSEIKTKIKRNGKTVQKIVDDFIDNKFKIDNKVKTKG